MNYEQKYKEALERARKSYNKAIEEGWTCDKCIYEEIFPELKEPEDERIRKEIISYIKSSAAVTNKDWISWLEKQKPSQQMIAGASKEVILPDYTNVNVPQKDWAEPKQKWSEEDEHRIGDAIYFLETARKHYASVEEINKTIDWLKSLKPNHWKPSKEQMEALKKRTHGLHTSSETRKALESLINDIEKL